MDKYERLVLSLPLGYGLSREDAADIAQVTFTILIQSLHTLPDDSRLGAWLATVARRHTWRLLDHNRRESVGEYGADLAQSAELLGKSDAESIEHWELNEWLEGGLSSISSPCRDLLFALYLRSERLSYAEIAERMDVPVGSIGPTRARCLKRLRKALDEG